MWQMPATTEVPPRGVPSTMTVPYPTWGLHRKILHGSGTILRSNICFVFIPDQRARVADVTCKIRGSKALFVDVSYSVTVI